MLSYSLHCSFFLTDGGYLVFLVKKKLCVGVCVVGEDRLGSKSFRWWGNIDVCGGATVVVGVGSEL